MSSLLAKIGSWFSKPKAQPVREIKARFDNAENTAENRRNWFMSDYFSAKAANNFWVRRQLRIRSRYEVSNNPYMWGVCNDNANDLVDKGPNLKVTTPNKSYNKAYEIAWKDWCDEVQFVEKLRTIKLARTVDGEGFLVLKTNPDQEHPVKLYPLDIEADQVTTPAPADLADLWIDGLTLNPITQRPSSFHVLKHHPGDFFFPDFNPLAVHEVPARHIIHWFPKWRPGQVRGVPIFTPSLDLWTEVRAFRKATLTKAQISAQIAGVFETEAPADQQDNPAPWKHIPMDRGAFITLPWGAKIKQYQTGDPATTHREFVHEALGEACRPLSYPLNRALGSSQDFNFSSAQLDHKGYHRSLGVERFDCDQVVLDHMLKEFHREATLVGLVPKGSVPSHEWHWPPLPVLDLAVETKADIDQINAGTTTLKEFWAKKNKDWEEILQQLADERDEMEKFKLVFGEPLKKQERINVEDPDADPATVKEAA